MASLDKRAYSRAFLRDADALLERLVLPMSFPWAQSREEELEQVFARDIDEMNGILLSGDPQMSTPSTLYNEVSTQQSTSRSADPGVVDYEVVYPATSLGHLQPPSQVTSVSISDPTLAGELYLRMFHNILATRQHQSALEGLRTRRFVSLNMASTSSRAKILCVHEKDHNPLLLSAILPSEVQYGTRTSRDEAGKLAEELGSYDCRYGRPNETDDKDFCHAGRNWSKKASHVPALVSLLTGEQMVSGVWRRPRDVRVGIKINGVLLSTKSSSSAMEILQDNHPNVYANLVDDAIEEACARAPRPADGLSQCRLDVDALLGLSLASSHNRKGTQNLDPGNLSASVKYLGMRLVLLVSPPVIDCFPVEGGILYTTCTVPGSMALECDISSVLDVTSSEQNICSICWNISSGVREENDTCVCAGCGLVVHCQCYGCSSVDRREQWRCDACLDCISDEKADITDMSDLKHLRWGISCAVCGDQGSSLVRQVDGTFVHNVCSLWRQPTSSEVARACALCGKYSQALIRCAAKNCLVEFHPLCALIMSNAADLHRLAMKTSPTLNTLSTAQEDMFLCLQFRLARLSVGSRASHGVETVPVAFCGLHNCDRRDDFYALPPGGKYLEGSMRIPPIPR